MKTLVLNIPDNVELDDKEALMSIAIHQYEKGRLSLGQAAELSGLSKRAFMELLSLHGISMFNMTASDLDSDIENAKEYHR